MKNTMTTNTKKIVIHIFQQLKQNLSQSFWKKCQVIFEVAGTMDKALLDKGTFSQLAINHFGTFMGNFSEFDNHLVKLFCL